MLALVAVLGSQEYGVERNRLKEPHSRMKRISYAFPTSQQMRECWVGIQEIAKNLLKWLVLRHPSLNLFSMSALTKVTETGVSPQCPFQLILKIIAQVAMGMRSRLFTNSFSRARALIPEQSTATSIESLR